VDRKKMGLAAASLLGAATLMTASPASADEIIICPCEVPGKPGSSDPFVKLETNFNKILIGLTPRVGQDSTAFNKVNDAFYKILIGL
jgi:hypothetical protein